MAQGGSVLLGSGERLKPLSRRYTTSTTDSAKISKIFPYDVPYLPARAVWQLVENAKPLALSDRVFAQLLHDVKRGDVPEAVMDALSPLRGKQFRLNEEEFRREVLKVLGPVAFASYGERIRGYCGECASITAPWTPERAEAHLQEEDLLKRRASVSDRLWAVWTQAERRGMPLTETQLRTWVRVEQLEQMLTPPMWVTHRARLRKVSALQLWDEQLRGRQSSLDQVRRAHMALLRQARGV